MGFQQRQKLSQIIMQIEKNQRRKLSQEQVELKTIRILIRIQILSILILVQIASRIVPFHLHLMVVSQLGRVTQQSMQGKELFS
jgi:hypothetical protein